MSRYHNPRQAAAPTPPAPNGTADSGDGPSSVLLAAPTLSGLVPVQGPVPGGTTVTLTGTNLTSATAVVFGGTAAASFTVV
ncbi:IPT/TIG domain-containing protein, partial [Streptomyces sp. NPDC020801]